MTTTRSTNNAFTQRYPAIQPAYTDGVLIHRRQDAVAPHLLAKAEQARVAYQRKVAKHQAAALSVAELTQKTLAFMKPHGTGFDPKDQRQL